MRRKKVNYPFEASVSTLRKYADAYVDSVFSCLESEFLVMPRGPGFVQYSTFETGYEALKRATQGFKCLDANTALAVVHETPIAFLGVHSPAIVIRSAS